MKPVPISTTPVLQQVEALRPIVEHRRCVVVGSAPIPTRYLYVGDEITLPVNGGISSIEGPIDCWVVNSKAQDEREILMRALHKTMLRQGAHRRIGHLLLLRGPKVASERFTTEYLRSIACHFEAYSLLDKSTKRWMEGEYCGRASDKHPCSSGILAAACALYAGAASVRLAGFSFKPGYHYLPNQQPAAWWRDHIPADKRALVALRARYGERLITDLLPKDVAA